MIKHYCPITGGLKTRITKHTYINACLKHQEYMGVKSPPGRGRRRDHTETCKICDIREAIQAGEPFEPPPGLEFIPLPKEPCTQPSISAVRPNVLTKVIERLGRGETQKSIAVALKLDKKTIRSIKKEYL